MKQLFLKTSIIAIALLPLLLFMTAGDSQSHSSGAPAARTGSPGDGNNCRACHSGTSAVMTPDLITSDIPADGYIPGTTYNITATISGGTSNKFGFEISPQTVSGQLRGTMILTEPTRTQLLSSGKYITHKTAGNTGSNNSNSWTFQWTAPAAGSGSLTFYGAFLAANANNSSSGDAVFLSTLDVQENTGTVSLAEKTNEEGWSLFPVPCSDVLYIRLPEHLSGNLHLAIISLEGKTVKTIHPDKVMSEQTLSLDISELDKGTYYVNCTDEKGNNFKRKIIKL